MSIPQVPEYCLLNTYFFEFLGPLFVKTTTLKSCLTNILISVLNLMGIPCIYWVSYQQKSVQKDSILLLKNKY